MFVKWSISESVEGYPLPAQQHCPSWIQEVRELGLLDGAAGSR